jgi:hypothetical protein
MADRSNPIHIPEDSELAGRLRESSALGHPVRIEANGTVYEGYFVEQPPRAKSRPDPETVRQLQEDIRAVTGAWQGFDAEEFNAYIRDRRKTANRPPVEL